MFQDNGDIEIELLRKGYPLLVDDKEYKAKNCAISVDGTKYCIFVHRSRFGCKSVLRLREGSWRIDDENKRIVIPNFKVLNYGL